MKVLVTGGAGYIGSVLVQELLEHGYEVTVLDNFTWGVPSLAGVCHHQNLWIVRGDARDLTMVQTLARASDVVIPLAALVGAPMCDARPTDAWDINCHAIRNMCDALPGMRFVIPITNSGYGIGGEDVCTEESPLQPVSTYGKTKVVAEEFVMQASEEGRISAVSLRLATVHGMSPRMRMDLLVNDFVWKAETQRSVVLYEASARRNYVHVRDVARAFLHVLSNWEKMRGNVYNVGDTDANMDKAALCERIKKYVPGFYYCEAPVGRDPDKRDYLVSNAKFEATGWRPAYSLDFGIQELVKGYRMFSQYPGRGNV